MYSFQHFSMDGPEMNLWYTAHNTSTIIHCYVLNIYILLYLFGDINEVFDLQQ